MESAGRGMGRLGTLEPLELLHRVGNITFLASNS